MGDEAAGVECGKGLDRLSGRLDDRHSITSPPLGDRQVPWKKLPSGEASSSAAGAISLTWAKRPSGIAAFNPSSSSSASGVSRSVWVTPGAPLSQEGVLCAQRRQDLGAEASDVLAGAGRVAAPLDHEGDVSDAGTCHGGGEASPAQLG